MSRFRDALGQGQPEERPDDDVPVVDDGLHDAEDAHFEEVSAPQPAVSASPAAAKPRKPRGGGRAQMWLGVVVVSVMLVGFVALLGGGGDNDPGAPKASTSTVKDDDKPAAKVKRAKVKRATPKVKRAVPTTGSEKNSGKRDGKTWSDDAGCGRCGGPDIRKLGYPTETEKREAKKLLDRAVALIKKWDHPADGRAGKLVNDSDKMAAALSDALGVPAVTKSDNMKPGVVYVKVERRVGLAILYVVAGKVGLPQVEQLQINSTGIGLPE